MRAFPEKRRYDDELPLQAFTSKDLDFMAHWHRDVEFLSVLSGGLSVGVNRRERFAGPGSLVICASADIHYYAKGEGGSESLLLIFAPELALSAAGWPNRRRLTSSVLVPEDCEGSPERGRFLSRARSLVKEITEEATERRLSYRTVIKGLVLELCGLVERTMTVPEEESGGVSMVGLGRMQRAIDYIHANAAYPISLADAAKSASLSPTYFSRAFSQTVGTGFSTYLNAVRVEKAQVLLAMSDRPVTDIAFECGFESVRTFNREFRKLRGVTPREARG
jgi:AraC-like DNA-binding protein